MNACIFCKIIAGDEPASVVYQDENFLVILDAYPLAAGHCLVIPKTHEQRLNQLNESLRTQLFELGHAVIEAQKACGFGVAGTNLLLNDGRAANQTVPHLHLHLIPRIKGDLLRSLPKLALHVTGLFGLKTKRALLDEHAAAIRLKLQYQP